MIESILSKIKKSGVRWIDLHFIGIDGKIYTKTIHSSNLSKSSFEQGIEVDLSSVFGVYGKQLYLVPEPSTYATVPWNRDYVRFICSIHEEGGNHFTRDSRYSLDRVYLNQSKFNLATIKTSIEYYIFDGLSVDRMEEKGELYSLDSIESPYNFTSLWSSDKGAYESGPKDIFYPMRAQIADTMESNFMYKLDSHEHGPGARGHQKASLSELELKRAADAFITFKYVVKNIAFLATKYATFMPLPLYNSLGNSLRVVFNLKKGSKSIFSKNQVREYFIGGILEHAEALALFTNPTTNSYKKLKLEPYYIAYSNTDNHALVSSHGDKVIFNAMDSSINPYLAYAAVLAAGFDGIKKKIQPPVEIDENICSMSEIRRKENKIRDMPATLLHAIDAFNSDSLFLKGFISYDLLSEYIEKKMEEFDEELKRPTPYEIINYFDI